MSKASYVRQANAICDQTKVKAKEFGTHAPTSAADFEVQLDKAYALLSDSTAKLNHLPPRPTTETNSTQRSWVP